jgi:hypothetical protein
MQTKPVFRHVLLAYEISREQKEGTHEACDQGIAHDEI